MFRIFKYQFCLLHHSSKASIAPFDNLPFLSPNLFRAIILNFTSNSKGILIVIAILSLQIKNWGELKTDPHIIVPQFQIPQTIF